ncbi:sulfotransferase family protein [Rhodoferax sp. PAMC 29310]|uniref:sulfotransferase family protein n=1 Tax=Rhodoferax sp. PAMC 29310 TaxID=2822760 RepID=UPI001B324C18|nr:hypothetical protein [Rhodoferax sp. PAMC 29310]
MAGFLANVGYNAGISLLPANEFNKKGYFESKLIVGEHDRLLESLGYTWQDIRPLPLDWLQQAGIAESKNRLAHIFQFEFAGDHPLVLKDPRLCRLLPLWQGLFDEVGIAPCYVLVLRRPEEVVASLLHRDGMPVNKAMLLYLAYLLDAERYTRKYQRVVVRYNALLQDWIPLLAELDSAFDLQLGELSPAVVEQVSQFLSPSLKHFNAVPGQQAAPDVAARLAERLYSALAAPSEQTDREMDDIRASFEQHLASLEPWLSEAAQLERLKQEVVRPGPLFHKIAGQGAMAQLFWRDVGGGISEAQSVRAPLAFGDGMQCLRFALPAAVSNVGGLRLDISDRPASCEIVGLRVVDAQGGPVWQWPAGTQMFEHCSKDMRLIDPQDACVSLRVVVTGGDPYATLCIPQPVVDQLAEGWSVLVDVSVALLTASVPPLLDLAAQRRQSLAEAHSALQDMALKMAATAKLAEAQQDQCRTELLRAEAQIELLKDIWLSDGRAEIL